MALVHLRNMHRLIPLLVLSILVGSAHAQLISLSGVVVNSSTSEPVPFAKVYLLDRTRGALTDEDGRFKIDGMAPGTHTLVVDAIDYEQKVFQGVEVRPGEQWVEFRVAELVLIGGPPVVTAKRRPWPWRWFVR